MAHITPGAGDSVEPFARVRGVSTAAKPSFLPGASNNANSTLQTGHTWASGGAGTVNLNYTSDFLRGSQCIQLVTDGLAGTVRAQVTRVTAQNLTGKSIRVWLKVVNGTNLNQIKVWLGSGASAFLNSVTRAVQIGADPTTYTEFAKVGEWVPFTFTPASLPTVVGTLDYTAVQDFKIEVSDLGGGNGTATVLLGGWEFFDNDASWPHGVISLCFDDGYQSPYLNAKAKLDQYGFSPTLYIIRDLIANSPGTYMSKAQLDTWATGGAEVAFHCDTVADHNAATGFIGMSTAAVSANFAALKAYMRTNGYRGVEHMATPQGKFDPALLTVLRQNFAAHRTVNFRSIETLPVADPYRLRCTGLDTSVTVTPNTTPNTLEWYVDQIYTYGGWGIFYTHEIVASASGSQFSSANFATFVDYIATKGVPVHTVGDVLGI